MPEKQASAHAHAFRRWIEDRVATKDDIEALHTKLDTVRANLEKAIEKAIKESEERIMNRLMVRMGIMIFFSMGLFASLASLLLIFR